MSSASTKGPLTVRGLSVGYGRMPVLHEVAFTVPQGSVLGVVGSNGAGKTTLLKTISGLISPWRGEVTLGPTRIDRASPEEIVRMGIAHVPQGRHVFVDMTVRENLVVGTTPRRKRGDTADTIQGAIEDWLNRFPILRTRADQPAGVLSGGEQQLLAIGRALVSDPHVLLMDEPTLGLSPSARDICFELIGEIRAAGCSVVLVEQDWERIQALAGDVLVLEFGKIRRRDHSSGGDNDRGGGSETSPAPSGGVRKSIVGP
jgi:branched-chain amino acid transport system ATP-binding protein